MDPTLQLIQDYLRKFPVSWTQAGLEELSYAFEEKQLSAGDLLLKEGQVCRSIALVVSGCLRSYVLDEGEEKSIFFFPEMYLCADSRSFFTEKPARHYIDALEDCNLLMLSLEKIRKLGSTHADIEHCYRAAIEKLLVSAENRLMLHVLSSPEQRYKRLLEDFGRVANRVPQKYLAPYLGITPVSLSRIRARVAANKG